MIDIGQKIRKGIYQALNGHITVSSKNIPVVDEKLETNISENDVYILFTTQNETDRNNKSYFARECDVVIRIVNHRLATGSKEIVEAVSSQLLTILFPTKDTIGFSIDSPLKISYAKLTLAEYDPMVQTEGGFVISKSLTIRARVTQ